MPTVEDANDAAQDGNLDTLKQLYEQYGILPSSLAPEYAGESGQLDGM